MTNQELAYLYLTMDPSLNIPLSFHLQAMAFCAGVLFGFEQCGDNPPFAELELGSTEQIRAIVNSVLNEVGEDPFNSSNKYSWLANHITNKYVSKDRLCFGEVDDSDPPTSSPFGVQRAFVSGHQAAFYFKNRSAVRPMEFHCTLYNTTDEILAELHEKAAEILNTITERFA